VYLAGLGIPDEDVRELAKLVDEPTRSFLEKALAMETGIVALTVAESRAHPPGARRCTDGRAGGAPGRLASGAGMAG
jgi:hypothetical protein